MAHAGPPRGPSRAEAFDQIFRRPAPPAHAQSQSQQPYGGGAYNQLEQQQQFARPYGPRQHQQHGAEGQSRPQSYYYGQPDAAYVGQQPHHHGNAGPSSAAPAAYGHAHRTQSPYYAADSQQQHAQRPAAAASPAIPPYADAADAQDYAQSTMTAAQRQSLSSPRSSFTSTMSSGSAHYSSRPSISSVTSLSHSHGQAPASPAPPPQSQHAATLGQSKPNTSGPPPRLPEFASSQHDDFFGFDSARAPDQRDSTDYAWPAAPASAAPYQTPPTPVARSISRGGSPGSMYDPGPYDDADRQSYAGAGGVYAAAQSREPGLHKSGSTLC